MKIIFYILEVNNLMIKTPFKINTFTIFFFYTKEYF